MPLELDPQPRRIYQQNPLKLVVCQLRFAQLLRFDEPGFVAPFQEALRTRYPRVNQVQSVSFVIGPGGPAPLPAPDPAWQLRDVANDWVVTISRNSLAVETSRYEKFEDFSERLDEAWAALQELGPIGSREFLGLRYVNEIRHPEARTPSSWHDWVSPELLGNVGGRLLDEDVIHALGEIRLRDRGVVLHIRHGLVGKEPSEGDPFYLLDIDCFDEVPADLSPSINLEQVKQMHLRTHDIFETCLTPRMREHLVIVREVPRA